MFKKWLFKLDRIIIWLLLFVTIFYLLSGYSLTYRFSAYKIISQDIASLMHAPLCLAFLILFLLHSFIAIYSAVLRQPSTTKLSVSLSRWAGWLLLVSILVMMVSGYSKVGTLPLLSSTTAVQLHTTFSFLVIPLFIVHVGVNSYYVIGKWVKSSAQYSTKE